MHESDFGGRNALIAMALSVALRLKMDNSRFDAPKWLDACSPNPEVYPISELWDEAMEAADRVGGE